MVYNKYGKLNRDILIESSKDWMKIQFSEDIKEVYWLMRAFILIYGEEIFWHHNSIKLDQQNMKPLTDNEKEAYLTTFYACEESFL